MKASSELAIARADDPAPAPGVAPDVVDSMLDNTRELLAYLDAEFTFVRVNQAYAEAGRRAPEEFVGKNHFALYPHPENQAIFERVRDTGVPAVWREKPFVYPDQPERGITYWDWTLTPIRDRAAHTVGLVFSLREITEAVRARRAVEESEQRYRGLFDRMSEAFALHELVLDDGGTARDFRFLEVNPAFERLVGRSAAAVVGRTYLELFPGGDPALVERLAAVVLTGQPLHVEDRFGDGRRWFDLSAYRTAPGHFATLFSDATARRAAHDELANRAETAQARLAAIVESSDDAICGLDLNGIVWTWNGGAERMYGWTEREMVGRSASVLAPPDRQGETEELAARLTRGERITAHETVRVARDGRRLDVSLTLSPIRDPGGAMIGISPEALARRVRELLDRRGRERPG